MVRGQFSAISGSCLELLLCFVLYCIVLYRIVLYCIISVWDQLSVTRLIWLGVSFLQFLGVVWNLAAAPLYGVVAAALGGSACRGGRATALSRRPRGTKSYRRDFRGVQNSLYCIVLYCIVSYCIVLYCVFVLYCILVFLYYIIVS